MTSAVALPVLWWIIWYGPKWVFTVLISILTALSAWEIAALSVGRSKLLRGWIIGVTLVLTLPALWLSGWIERQALASMCVLVVGGLTVALLRPKVVFDSPATIGWLLAAPLYLIAGLVTAHELHQHHAGWLFLSLTVAWFSDTLAYFVGRKWGKHPLYPAVSPKKTIEGALGGVCGSVLATLLAHRYYLYLPLVHSIILGISASCVGQIGDLAESLIKRTSGTKDSGNLIPGHGGVLDRLDAFFFTSVLIWLYADQLQLWNLPDMK